MILVKVMTTSNFSSSSSKPLSGGLFEPLATFYFDDNRRANLILIKNVLTRINTTIGTISFSLIRAVYFL